MTKSNNLLADYAAKKQDICIKNDTISDSLFREYGVNRGLRDVNGKGVLTGLTNISEIVSFKTGEDGSTTASPARKQRKLTFGSTSKISQEATLSSPATGKCHLTGQ